VLRGDEVNVVHSPHGLEFEVPFAELFGREVETSRLVRDVIVLAEDAAEIAARCHT